MIKDICVKGTFVLDITEVCFNFPLLREAFLILSCFTITIDNGQPWSVEF